MSIYFTCDSAARIRPLQFTSDQTDALCRIDEWFKNSRRQYFVLHGLAGTGKTSLLKIVAGWYPSAILAAPTGKAASVLAGVARRPASTMHAVIYRLRAQRLEDGRRILEFDPKLGRDELSGQLVLLDEGSMISERIARDLLDTGARVLVAGDPGQLPPVEGRQFFTEPDAVLKEIHRQAQDSPIIRQAHEVRAGYHYESDGPDFVARSIRPDDLNLADIVLCHRNDTRHDVNRIVRRMRGLSGPPQRDEQVVCLKNVPRLGLYNGSVYRVIAYDQQRRRFVLDVEGVPKTVDDAEFTTDDSFNFHGCTTAFDFGYALTVHKSQGSQWRNVAIIAETSVPNKQWAPWTYTAITRASERIVIGRRS